MFVFQLTDAFAAGAVEDLGNEHIIPVGLGDVITLPQIFRLNLSQVVFKKCAKRNLFEKGVRFLNDLTGQTRILLTKKITSHLALSRC